MLDIDYKDIVLFIAATINLLLAGIIFFRNTKNKINIYYGLAVFFAGTWTFGIAMFRLSSFESAYFWMFFYYISASLIAIYYLYFAINFLRKNTKSVLLRCLLYLKCLLLLLIPHSFPIRI